MVLIVDPTYWEAFGQCLEYEVTDNNDRGRVTSYTRRRMSRRCENGASVDNNRRMKEKRCCNVGDVGSHIT